ncbi:MAG TPA: hypothetical protein EYN96_10320 [Candidatus Hydrogenedentes bacterium]|nr:hypothetical protein [Candidatus Hydrogenedentota bacterium]
MIDRSVCRLINFLAWLLVVAITPFSHAASSEAEAAARRTLDSFMVAWNQADNVELRKAMNFPNVTLAGSRMIIANEPEDFSTDFERMREQEGWAKSSFDRITVTRSAPEKVHCNVVYSRRKADGSAYRTATVFYVITKKDDHWGMQFRGPGIVPSEPLSADQRQAVVSAEEAVQQFFTAFNGADNAALLDTLNLPHAFLLDNGALAAAHDPSGPLVAMDFDGMREREGWHMSSIDSLTPVQVSPGSVSFELVFSRYHQNGMKYRTVPALWVLTDKEGHWGVQFRSLMPATYSD